MIEPSKTEKVYMLNALWFLADGGRKKYDEYMKSVAPLVRKYGARKLRSFYPVESLIGEFEADLVFVVEWPDLETFDTFIHDPDFIKVQHLREEALERSLLIRCRSED